jgi:hypothetical protein
MTQVSVQGTDANLGHPAEQFGIRPSCPAADNSSKQISECLILPDTKREGNHGCK